MTLKSVTVLLFLLTLSTHAAAQTTDLRLPVIIDADRTDYDGRTSMLMFTGLRLTQGNIGINADVAHASRMDFDDSVWQFSGNVVFDVEEGHVTCDSADLRFSDFQLMAATIVGNPATFEFRRAGTDQTTYAEAERLYYDVVAGTIEFSGDATITEGGNVISSETLIYNILEQRINASGNGEERVTVTYTPPEADAAAIEETDDAANSDSEPAEEIEDPEGGAGEVAEDAPTDEAEATEVGEPSDPEDGSE